MDNIDIKQRLKVLESERSNIESTWELIEQFVVPFRGEFFREEKDENAVNWRQRDVYDSTAIMSLQTLASSIHGSLTSPSFQWFDLAFRNDDLNTKKDAKQWLQECAKRVYNALQDSNFNLEVNESYTDLGAFGSSVIVEELDGDEMDEEAGVVFNTVPLKECFFEEDHKGKIYNFYRKLAWTPVQICDKFGDKVPEYIRQQVEQSGSLDKKYDVIFCIYRRKGVAENQSTIASPANRPYGYKYVLSKDCTTLGTEGGYYEMPAFVPRWRRTTNSKWGHSPAMISLPDILTVNQLVELTMRSLEKVVDPATLVTERGLLSDLDLAAGGLTVVRTMDDIMPFESRARFDVAELHVDKLRMAIRSAFYVDQLELKESPAMTATEVQVRYELMQRLLGPTLGRLQSDFLSPMIERTFYILFRSNKLPEMPESVVESELDITYTGPLTSAQKVDQAAKVERWLQNMAGVAEIDPTVLDLIDIDEVGRGLADTLNIDQKYLRSSEKLVALRRQRQQQQQQMQQAQMAKEAGDAGQSVVKAARMAEGQNVE